MYSVHAFGEMAADPVRADAYSRALRAAVTPGSVVLEIGAGTGYFSLLAAAAGAKRVHACDPNPAIWLVQDLARANGFGDRIVIHPRPSTEIDLPEKADIVIADLRGTMPMMERNFAALRDAKARHLRAGGRMLPLRDEFFVALFESDAFATHLSRGTIAFERRGWNVAAIHDSIVNTVTRDSSRVVTASDLLTSGRVWGSVTYGEPTASLESSLTLDVTRGGRAHGLVLWFEATIAEGIRYGTEPGTGGVYSRLLLPLPAPVEVAPGDRVNVTVRATETGDRWAWDTAFVRTAGVVRHRQSSFFGIPASPAAILRGSSQHRPALTAAGERAQRALALMDGTRTIDAIADELAASAPSVAREDLVDEIRALGMRFGQ